MDKMPLLAVLFQSIPETIVIVLFGLTLINEERPFFKIFIIGCLTAAASYFIRSLHIPFGLHSVITIFSVYFFTWIVTGIKITVLLLGLVPALMFYGVLELSIMPLIINLTGLNLDQVLNNIWLRIVLPIPLYLIYLFLVFLIRKNNWNILGKFKYSL